MRHLTQINTTIFKKFDSQTQVQLFSLTIQHQLQLIWYDDQPISVGTSMVYSYHIKDKPKTSNVCLISENDL